MILDSPQRFHTLSTDSVSPRERSQFWEDALHESFGAVHVDTYGRDAFDGKIRAIRCGQTSLYRVTAGAHRAPNLPRQVPGPPYRYKVVMQLQGKTRFEQDGLAACLTPGQWTVYDATRPYHMTAEQSVDLVTMVLPHDSLLASMRDRDRVLLKSHSSGTSAGRRLAAGMMAACGAPAQAEAAVAQLGSHLSAAVNELLDGAPPCRLPAVMRHRIVEYIEGRLDQPSLSIGQIAQALHCSSRYLHMVFGADGTTLARYIQQARLMRICRDLADPALRTRSITEISMRWGFVDSGHFSRSFRQAFGVTPRAFRAARATAVAGR